MKFNRWVDYINFLVVHCEQQDDLYKKCSVHSVSLQSFLMSDLFVYSLTRSLVDLEHYDAEDDIAGLFDCTPGLP